MENLLLQKQRTIMPAATARIILSVDKEKEQAFLQMLQLFDFVKVESKEELLRRFIQNAPQNVPLSEADVVNEVMEHRYGKKQ
jgi:hypothetical protein